jgi:glycosyltransferase involved in cell wall biosynthesis
MSLAIVRPSGRALRSSARGAPDVMRRDRPSFASRARNPSAQSRAAAREAAAGLERGRARRKVGIASVGAGRPKEDGVTRGRHGLRIGIDGTCLGSSRGYGRFARELLPPLFASDPGNDYALFLDAQTADEVDLAPVVAGARNVRLVRLDTAESQARAASARGSRGPADLLRMGVAVARAPLDVFYFPSVYSYFPVPSRLPLAIGFMDTIADRFARVVFPTRRNRWLWQAKAALARRQARVLLTLSEYSKRCLHEFFGVSEERIVVTPCAPSPVFGPVPADDPRRREAAALLAARGVPEGDPYVIYVGGVNPHKNVPALVRAFAAACAARPSSRLRLLLVGDFEGDVFHADVSGLRGEIARLGVADRVHFAGFVPDPELRPLYAGALLCALPSLEEGFGLPAVEAAACGTPCVATTRSPLPELLEGGGIFVPPEDEAGLRDALLRIEGDPALRARLAAGARERAAKLSWPASAAIARDAITSIARAPRGAGSAR